MLSFPAIDTNEVMPSAIKYRLIQTKKKTKQEYIENLNKLFVYRLEIGYKKDNVLKLQQRNISEAQQYRICHKIFLEQAQNLEKFVAEDYKKSMDLLKASDQLKLRIDKQRLNYLNVASKVYTIRCEINTLDARYRVLKQYHRFLFMLSPSHWREQFEVTSRMGGSEISSNSEVQTHSFTNIAKYVYNDLTIHSKQQLYFKNTMEIENLLTLMEKLNYDDYHHLGQLSSQIMDLKSGITAIEKNIHYEHSLIQDTMEYFEKCIQYGIEKADGLRNIFFSNMYNNGNMFDLIASKKVLKLIMAVEYCFESIIEENCGSFTLLEMVKELEIDFLNNCSYLDSCDRKVVLNFLMDSFSSDMRIMKQASIADKKLKSLKTLTKSMCRIIDPPVKPERSKKKRSYIPIMKKVKKEKKVEPNIYLTPSDIQYLTFFTDWTKNEDPKIFLANKKYC